MTEAGAKRVTLDRHDVRCIRDAIDTQEILWLFRGNEIFDEQLGLAHLLINDVVSFVRVKTIGTNPATAPAPGEIGDAGDDSKTKGLAQIVVPCHGVFGLGATDHEPLAYDEIEPLYRAWRADPEWGAVAWCIATRDESPVASVRDLMLESGSWTDKLEEVWSRVLS